MSNKFENNPANDIGHVTDKESHKSPNQKKRTNKSYSSKANRKTAPDSKRGTTTNQDFTREGYYETPISLQPPPMSQMFFPPMHMPGQHMFDPSQRPGSAQVRRNLIHSQMSQPFSYGPGPFPMMAPPSNGYISDAMTQASIPAFSGAGGSGDFAQENMQLKAKIALLERKIRAKDQLFDDSLSSSFAGCASTTGAEYTNLINKLKKKVLMLQTKNDQSEQEIKRLTKSVRIVEVEVKEENEPLRTEIARLTQVSERLQHQLDAANQQLDATQRERVQMQQKIDQMAEQNQKNMLSITQLQQQLQNSQNTLKSTLEELRESRESVKQLESKIKHLDGALSDKKHKKKQLKSDLKHLHEKYDKDVEELEKKLKQANSLFIELQESSKKELNGLKESIKKLEYQLENSKHVDDSKSDKSSGEHKAKAKELKKQLKHLEEAHSKCEWTISELKKTQHELQDRLDEKEIMIRKLSEHAQTKEVVKERVVPVFVERQHNHGETHSDDEKSQKKEKKSKDKKKSDEKKAKKIKNQRSDSFSSSDQVDQSYFQEQISELKMQIELVNKEKSILSEMFTKSSENHQQELKKLRSEQEDKIMRLEAEIEELYTELDKEHEAEQKLAGDAFSAIVGQAQAVKEREDFKIKQARDIRQLKEDLDKYIKEITEKETEMRLIVEQNNKLIAANQQSVKVTDKYIRVERIVPQVIEKVVKIEKIVEKDSPDVHTKLMEEERAILKRDIRNEFKEKIGELEANILAYQDLLIAKETDIKAYATELSALQKLKAGSLNEAQLIKSLEKLVQDKQREIEALKNSDIRVGGLPAKVYKKLEHVNAQIDDKMKIVHKNFEKETKRITNGFLLEIEQLKLENQKVIDSIPLLTKEMVEKHKIEIEQITLSLINHKEAYKKKSAECSELQKRLREMADEMYDLEVKQRELEAKHKRCHTNQQKEFEANTVELQEEIEKLKNDYNILKKSYDKVVNIGSSKESNLIADLTHDKAQAEVKINKLELIILDLKNKVEQKDIECSKHKRESREIDRLLLRCDQLEKDSQAWIAERDKLIAKFKTDLELENKKYQAMLSLATETLKIQLENAQKETADKQTEIEALMVRLEKLETSKSTDQLLVEDIHRRYKLQIFNLKKENEDLKNRFNIYCENLTLKLSKAAHRTERELLVEIETLKANERAIILEQQAIAAQQVKDARAEMQIEIDKLTVQITVCYERMARRDNEIRRLLSEIETLKEWEVRYKDLQRKHAKELADVKAAYDKQINDMRAAYERQISDMRAEYERVKKELSRLTEVYESLKIEHAKCASIIYNLQEEIRLLKLQWAEHKCAMPATGKDSDRSYVESEEKLEIVGVLDVHQFDVVEEKKK